MDSIKCKPSQATACPGRPRCLFLVPDCTVFSITVLVTVLIDVMRRDPSPSRGSPVLVVGARLRNSSSCLSGHCPALECHFPERELRFRIFIVLSEVRAHQPKCGLRPESYPAARVQAAGAGRWGGGRDGVSLAGRPGSGDAPKAPPLPSPYRRAAHAMFYSEPLARATHIALRPAPVREGAGETDSGGFSTQRRDGPTARPGR